MKNSESFPTAKAERVFSRPCHGTLGLPSRGSIIYWGAVDFPPEHVGTTGTVPGSWGGWDLILGAGAPSLGSLWSAVN